MSICLLIMLNTLLLRPSLHCNTSLHFTTFHPTTFHYTYGHFTSSHLHFTTLSFGLTHLHFLSFYYTSHHYCRHSTVLISKLISKIMNPFTVLGTSHHFTSLHFLFIYFFTYPLNPSLYYAIHIYSSLPFTSLSFTFYFLLPSLPLTGFHFPNLRFTM